MNFRNDSVSSVGGGFALPAESTHENNLSDKMLKNNTTKIAQQDRALLKNKNSGMAEPNSGKKINAKISPK